MSDLRSPSMSHAAALVSVAHSYRRPPVVGIMLALSLCLNILALILPFVVMDAAGSDPLIYGLLGSVQMLLDSQMVVLAGLVVVFSVIFPFAKLATLAWLWWRGVTTERRHSVLMWVEKLGKWSLFDVFLVAIMIGLTNDQWLISSASLPGLTCFMGAVILGMLAGSQMRILCYPSVEFLAEVRFIGEHLHRKVFKQVIGIVLLLFEDAVEETPAEKAVVGFWFQGFRQVTARGLIQFDVIITGLSRNRADITA